MGPKKKGKEAKVKRKASAKGKGKEAREALAKRRSPSKKSKTEVEQEQLPEIIADTIVEYLHEVEGDSPIDLDWAIFFKIRAASIEWTNWGLIPENLTLRNSCYNVILTGTWPPGMTPSVTKGPMVCKYDFAQAHFHWGPDSSTGSDHLVGGVALPFEVHLVFYKETSGSLAEAKKEEDGVVIFCYLFKISELDNAMMQPITTNIKEVTYTLAEKELDPVSLGELFPPITDDFIAYLGNMKYKTVHGVTFVISRETHFISERQLVGFRNLKDRHENPMILNAREVVGYNGRYVFVMNPKNTNVTSVLVTSTKSSYRSSTKSSASQKSKRGSRIGSGKRSGKGSKKGKNKGSSKVSKSAKSEGEELRKGSIKSRKRPSKKSKKSKRSKSLKKKSKSKKKKPSKKQKSKK